MIFLLASARATVQITSQDQGTQLLAMQLCVCALMLTFLTLLVAQLRDAGICRWFLQPALLLQHDASSQ